MYSDNHPSIPYLSNEYHNKLSSKDVTQFFFATFLCFSASTQVLESYFPDIESLLKIIKKSNFVIEQRGILFFMI